MSMRESAAVVAADVLTADVLARVQRASNAAANTYRLARYGYTAADVAADVTADIWATYALGERPNTSAVAVGREAKRVADRIRRENVRESAADVLSQLAAEDGQTADSGTRQMAAVNGRKARHGVPKRTDVLAVAESSRENMRAAEDCYLASTTAARLLAEMARPHMPSRAAERDAWNMLTELAETVSVPSHGIGSADVVTIASNGERTEPRHGSAAKDTAGRVVGRSRVFVCSPSVPMTSRADRAVLRSAERAAVSELADAERGYGAAVAAADALGESSETADVLAAADVLADARRVLADIRLERERATRSSSASIAIDYRAETVSVSIACESAADALLTGYRAERLAERVSAKRAAKATAGKGFNPSPLKLTAETRDAVGRNWLLAEPRRIKWSAAMPSADTATRRAVQRAAVAWRGNVLAAVGRSWDTDAETAAYRADAAEQLRAAVAERADVYRAADVPSGRRSVSFSHVWNTETADRETAAERAERLALSHAYGFDNGNWSTNLYAQMAIDAADNRAKPWLSLADGARRRIEAMRVD